MKVLVRIELVVDSNKDVVQQITDAGKNVVESNPNTIEVAYARAFPCSLASKSCDQADEADDNKRDHSEMEVKRVAVKEAVKRRTIKRIAIMHASAARLDEIHAALNRPALPELLGLFRALPLGRPIPAIEVPNDRYPRHRQLYRIVKAALVSHNDIGAAFEV